MTEINKYAQEQIEQIKHKCENIKPLVIIWCLTYNHQAYLKDALEGFIFQKTNFPFVAIVHEDASTDGTAEILREYSEKFPDLILPIFEKENQYSKGAFGLISLIMNKVTEVTGAKYIAMCEGDDYWTVPFKLQKQIDFLESHPNIDYTCHRYKIQNNNSDCIYLAPNAYLDRNTSKKGFEFDLQYVFKNDWVTKTLTSVYRIECLKYDELKDCYFYRDVHNIYQILSKSNGYCFQFDGGVYRKQETGIWSQSDYLTKIYTEVKTWESIYHKIPTKFNLWKFRNNYTLYIIQSIRQKKKIKIGNLTEFFTLFFFPFELFKILRKKIKNKKLDE